ALFSFIHSLNTNFGTSIFEPVAREMSILRFKRVESQAVAGEYISSDAFGVIQEIITDLTAAKGSVPNKLVEIEKIRAVCRSGKMQKVKLTKVDVLITNHDDELFLFDIKTAKPNAGGFKEFKRTLLEWVAAVLANDPTAKVHSFIAIPYNPYHPNPYSRWTMRGMLDLEQELKVAEEFWDFLGGENCYQPLLDVFEQVGIELRPEIDSYFTKFIKE
ncbi:MAG TPA: TdeIII family type II restriction endonuclease, partial [Chitinophagales bacterium]|nr:TdeIII family type II restriction endonuclease [Chitinophagales bacterium]